MAFDWKLYVRVCEEIRDNPRTPALEEAYVRTCISRAYYGAYQIARTLLLNVNPGGVGLGKHEDVRDIFLESTNEANKSVGYQLVTLVKLRVDADYKSDKALSISDAKTAINYANRIINKLDECVF